jgi:hypothetical protein
LPFIGAAFEANTAAVSAGQNNPTEVIYRCPEDNSQRTAFINNGVIEGRANRTSYLLNSQLSHKTRRWGHWNFASLGTLVGTSNFVDFCERNADAIANDHALAGDPRQDDYDIWLGVVNFQPWIATTRHTGCPNYLYLDGYVASYSWPVLDATSPAGIFMFPDYYRFTASNSTGYQISTVRLTTQGFFATETSSDDPWAWHKVAEVVRLRMPAFRRPLGARWAADCPL